MNDEPRATSSDTAARGAAGPALWFGTKVSSLVGIVAAMVLAVLVNVLVARHYKRWDMTRGGLYTLSEATVATLHTLEEPVQIYVLLPDGDPLALSIHHLLETYRAETSRLDVASTDPDHHPAEFIGVRQRYGITPEDGPIALVVARGDRKHFVRPTDLVQVEDENDLRARPRLEQTLTAAIRTVTSSETPKACFSTGHGEGSLDVGMRSDLAHLEDKLTKNNFEIVEVPPAKSPQAASVPLAACRLLIVSGPTDPVPAEDVKRMRAYVEAGGNVLVAVSPAFEDDNKHLRRLGLDDLFELGGVRLEQDFVFERDPEHRSTRGIGETLIPIAKPHAITEKLLKSADRGIDVVMTVASSMTATGAGTAAPVPLLVTTDSAFGMIDFLDWATHPTTNPTPTSSDHKGPLTVAFAAELPKRRGSDAPHGPRMVFISSASVLFGANWQSPELRGTRLFVQDAIGWLTAQPAIVDVPPKPSFTAGLLLDEDKLASVYRYAVLLIPLLGSALPGIAIALLRRRSSRRKPARGRPKQ